MGGPGQRPESPSPCATAFRRRTQGRALAPPTLTTRAHAGVFARAGGQPADGYTLGAVTNSFDTLDVRHADCNCAPPLPPSAREAGLPREGDGRGRPREVGTQEGQEKAGDSARARPDSAEPPPPSPAVISAAISTPPPPPAAHGGGTAMPGRWRRRPESERGWRPAAS